MYEGNRFNSPLVKLKNTSPLVWAIILLALAGLFALIPLQFFKILTIPPLLLGGLLFYQAVFKNKY
ncbi:MAG TPA: hypothetical protein VIH52_01850 [Candidatus Nanoarchaeia archaeon]|nr:hypothetical protein [uncultured archaeon]